MSKSLQPQSFNLVKDANGTTQVARSVGCVRTDSRSNIQNLICLESMVHVWLVAGEPPLLLIDVN